MSTLLTFLRTCRQVEFPLRIALPMLEGIVGVPIYMVGRVLGLGLLAVRENRSCSRARAIHIRIRGEVGSILSHQRTNGLALGTRGSEQGHYYTERGHYYKAKIGASPSSSLSGLWESLQVGTLRIGIPSEPQANLSLCFIVFKPIFGLR